MILAIASFSKDSFPSHDTSGRKNNDAEEDGLFSLLARFNASSPHGYSPPDCERAASGMDWSHGESVYVLMLMFKP